MAVDTRTGGFLAVTGVTFTAFASGFGDCLFDLNKIDACIAVAHHWQDVLQATGQHIVTWGLTLTKAILQHG